LKLTLIYNVKNKLYLLYRYFSSFLVFESRILQQINQYQHWKEWNVICFISKTRKSITYLVSLSKKTALSVCLYKLDKVKVRVFHLKLHHGIKDTPYHSLIIFHISLSLTFSYRSNTTAKFRQSSSVLIWQYCFSIQFQR